MDKSKTTEPTSDLAPVSGPTGNCDSATKKDDAVQEIGGRIGPDPTRFGDWEKAGRCIDF